MLFTPQKCVEWVQSMDQAFSPIAAFPHPLSLDHSRARACAGSAPASSNKFAHTLKSYPKNGLSSHRTYQIISRRNHAPTAAYPHFYFKGKPVDALSWAYARDLNRLWHPGHVLPTKRKTASSAKATLSPIGWRTFLRTSP